MIAVECVNRFETHFLNIAADAVQYCKDVGNKNMKVHLDCFHMIREEKKLCGRGKDLRQGLPGVCPCERK